MVAFTTAWTSGRYFGEIYYRYVSFECQWVSWNSIYLILLKIMVWIPVAADKSVV